MDPSWNCRLRVTQHEAKLLVHTPHGDLLKARLDASPCHPRALLTLLEGLSLWNGRPLCVALSVDESCHHLPGSPLLGDALWPAESQLVQFDIVHRAHRRTKLSGLGDFRQLRLALHGRTP